MVAAAARARKRGLEERMTVSLMICQRTCFNIGGGPWMVGGRGSGRGGANVNYQLKFDLFVICQLTFLPFVSCQLSGSAVYN